MQSLLPYIGNALVTLGAFILAISAIPVLRLLGRLPSGDIRYYWQFLIWLIAFFFIGYLSYLYFFQNNYQSLISLIVPSIFFFGAIFVLTVCSLALRTANDLVRVYTLKNESITDPLMGTFNRRYIDKQLPIEVAKAKENEKPLAVLLVNIDDYEQLKFKLGHERTDTLLACYGKQVSERVTNTDTVARYGDDQIIIIQPNADEHASYALATRLSEHFNAQSIPVGNEQTKTIDKVSIQVNIGIALLRHLKTDPDNLIEAADRALYQAKQNGPNKIALNH